MKRNPNLMFRPLICASTIAVCAVACAAFAQKGTPMISIETMTIGIPPAGFEFARTGQGKPGQWNVVSDSAATGGRAIEQSSTDRTDYRFPLAIYAAMSAKNVEASVNFKAIAGAIDRAGGIAVRLIDSNNYYVVRANALEDNVRLYRVVNGSREQIAGADTKVSPSEWHTLSLKANGERLTVSFDGKQLYTTNDKTFSAAGKIALWTKADSVTRFDRMVINQLP